MAKKLKIIIISITILLLAGCSFGNRKINQEDQQKKDINLETTDPFSLVNCENDAETYYWDFTSTSDDISELKESGKNKNNFYILCNPAGSGGFRDVYVFRNNKMIFERNGIYQGTVFFDKGNNFNIFKGVQEEGVPNCCPKSFELTSYKYDLQIDTMKIVETKNYSAQEFEDLGKIPPLPEEEIVDFKNKKPTSQIDKENCESAGGEWAIILLGQRGVYNMPAITDGKECSDESECDGACIAESEKATKGNCSNWTIALGCRYYMVKGKAVSMCKD